MTTLNLPFALADVFASEPLSGNGLAVFLLAEELPAALMQRIAVEMRQFESIFLRPAGTPSCFAARIFTMEEELPFAGHPIIGAAATLHANLLPNETVAEFEFVVAGRHIRAISRRDETDYWAEMDQGSASIGAPLAKVGEAPFLRALGLTAKDRVPGLPMQVVSTGLPYLIVPILANLQRAHIRAPGFEALLATVGAKFVYVLDVSRHEGRTWDNEGKVEDIATGSAAGPAGAYLVRHGRARPGEAIVLSQGRFAGRPSELHVFVGSGNSPSVLVRGQVCAVGEGTLSFTFRSGS